MVKELEEVCLEEDLRVLHRVEIFLEVQEPQLNLSHRNLPQDYLDNKLNQHQVEVCLEVLNQHSLHFNLLHPYFQVLSQPVLFKALKRLLPYSVVSNKLPYQQQEACSVELHKHLRLRNLVLIQAVCLEEELRLLNLKQVDCLESQQQLNHQAYSVRQQHLKLRHNLSLEWEISLAKSSRHHHKQYLVKLLCQ